MIIVRSIPCPHCRHMIRVSVKQMSKGHYAVTFFDGKDKMGKAKTVRCPGCRVDLFQSDMMKALTGLELAQLES